MPALAVLGALRFSGGGFVGPLGVIRLALPGGSAPGLPSRALQRTQKNYRPTWSVIYSKNKSAENRQIEGLRTAFKKEISSALTAQDWSGR
jgi:hypothetical protein